MDSSTVTNVNSASNGVSYGFFTSGTGGTASNNKASNITVSGSLTINSDGVMGFDFARGNNIYNAYFGISNCTKYQDNLTASCTTAFDGGTDAGGNF